jgi:hypothetical protein
MDASSAEGSAQAQTRICDAHLAWDKQCAALETAPREGEFWGETTCLMGPWRYLQAAYLDAAVSCFDSLPCERNDDTCITAGFHALGIDDDSDLQGDREIERCVALADTCGDLSEDVCFFFAAYTQQARRNAVSCLDLECSAIEDCLLDPG